MVDTSYYLWGETNAKNGAQTGPEVRPALPVGAVASYPIDSMFFPTTSIVCWKSAVGLNSTISVPG